jgi:DNA replication licensing factor MCM4
MSGKIDVNILTTGMSSNARKRRGEIAAALRKMVESKGKISTMNYQKAFNEFKAGSAMVSDLILFLKLFSLTDIFFWILL